MTVKIEHPGRPYLFDRLTAFCRRWWPEPLPYFDEVRLFFVPDVAHAEDDLTQDPELWTWAQDNFALPFQHTGIEDYASCLLLYDLAPGGVGMRAPRAFIDCISLDDRFQVLADDPEAAAQAREFLTRDLRFTRDEAREVCRVNVGFLMAVYTVDGKRKFDGALTETFLMHPTKGRIEMIGDNKPTASQIKVGKGGKITAGTNKMPDQIQVHEDGTVDFVTDRDVQAEKANGAMRNVVAAVEQLMVRSRPGRLLVERTEPRRKLTKKQRRQGKTEADIVQPRPRYMLLTPDETREKFNLPQATDVVGTHTVGKATYTVRSDS